MRRHSLWDKLRSDRSCGWRRAVVGLGLSGALILEAVSARAAPTAAAGPTRRYALIVGANDGGKGRVRLKYAHADARAMARVLTQLGGVSQQDLVLLLNPNRITLLGGLYKMRTKLQAARGGGRRVELVFYYSGHSDEQGLLLHGQRFTYREVRRAVGDFPADLRVAVLDSCASGVLTRIKGGQRRPPFLVDQAADLKGRVYLTSASGNEGAQESDRIRGSFFTHYLISGLRGAADANRDRKITLSEAYQYAFHETLKQTQGSRAGPQHASYDMQLKGSGDLVLTDLRSAEARLVLSVALGGRVFVRDRQGRLVAEIVKPTGRQIVIGLPRGRYQVALQSGGQLRQATVQLRRRARTVLKSRALTLASAADAAALKGSVPGALPVPPGHTLRARRYKIRPATIALVPGLSLNDGSDGTVRNYFSFNLLCDRGNHLLGLELSLGCSIRTGNVYGFQLSLLANHVQGAFWGWQLGSIYNAVFQDFIGWQLSTGGNYAGSLKGWQLGAAFSYTRGDLQGFQGGLGFGYAGRLAGVQISSANVVRGRMYGWQAGGVNLGLAQVAGFQASAVNVAGRFYGAQVGGVNVAYQGLSGAQLGAVNVAVGPTRGLQLGAVNVAGRAKGVQFGVVNVAHTDWGLVPIGLVSVAGNGLFAPTLWSTGSAYFNLGFKFGSRRIYNIFGFGLQPGTYEPEPATGEEKPQTRWSLLGGVGGHIETGHRRLYVDIDFLIQRLVSDQSKLDEQDWITSLRAVLGVRLISQLSLYAGPSLDLLVSNHRDHLRGATWALWSRSGDPLDRSALSFELGLSFVVGLSFEPGWGRLNGFM